MKIKITAIDTLFFRDGKPFSMGEDTWATGIFPPLPSVFYGMLRTTYAAQNNIPIDAIEEKTKDLRIVSILLQYKENCIFPFPADMYSIYKLAKDKKSLVLEIADNEYISNVDIEYYPNILKTSNDYKKEKVKEYFGKAFLNEETKEFSQYLLNSKKEYYFEKYSDYLFSEAKIGIGKDFHTNITSEGKLYRVGMLRLEDFSFIVHFEGLVLEKKGLMKMGAENKTVQFSEIIQSEIELPEINTTKVKIYLSTPAIFETGSMPEFIKEGNYEGIKFKFITCAIGKPIYIGGFDMQGNNGKGCPKPMKKAVPAGSVYYLETNSIEDARKMAFKIHGKSIAGIAEEYAKQGFGICYCGTF